MKDLAGKIFKGPCLFFFILSFLYGCSGTSTGNPGPMAGTGTGNPGDIGTDSQTYVSAFPDPMLPGCDGLCTEDPDNYTDYPDIFQRTGQILFVGEGGRGTQIIDLPFNKTPVMRGNIDIANIDITLSDAKAYLYSNYTLNIIDVHDKDQPLLEETISFGTDVLKLFIYSEDFIRLSTHYDVEDSSRYYQVDLIPLYEMDQPVARGLTLPIKIDSANEYGDSLWLRGRSSANGNYYLIGIDLVKLSLEQELLDFSDLISVSPDSIPLPDPDSPIFAITEIPNTNYYDDLFYIGPSFTKIMEMQYGIWMEIPLYAVIADGSLYVYDLNNNGELSSAIPVSFLPESFFASDSTLSFSYLNNVDAPEGEDTTKSFSQFFYNSFDLSDPANPIESGEVNIPGTLLSLVDGQIFTLDFSWNEDGNLIETVKSGQVIENSMIVDGEYPLLQRTSNRLVSRSSVIVVMFGEEEDQWADLISIIDFSAPENLVEVVN